MADEVKKLERYSIEVPDKAGHGAKALGALKEAGVNFIGVWGYPIKGKKARIDVIAEDAALLKKAAKNAGIALGPKAVSFFINGEDRPGAVLETLAKLAEKGISVVAVQAVCGGAGRYGATLQVADDDVKKAAKALGA